jgi:hypothetical protein
MIYEFIWEAAGIVGLDPSPFSFHQIMLMRKGCEGERWDRLSYELAVYMSSKGAKNITVEQFHKFKMEQKPQMTTDALRALKGNF